MSAAELDALGPILVIEIRVRLRRRISDLRVGRLLGHFEVVLNCGCKTALMSVGEARGAPESAIGAKRT